MTTIYPATLSEKEVRILTYTFIYRGMRAKDFAVFETNTFSYSLSDEKSIYNYLAKLKRKGLIKSTRLQGVSSLGSIYYLSPTGLEIIKGLLNISIGENGNGLLPISEETTFWDVPTEYQVPPIKQTKHFLQGIEFFKQIVAERNIPLTHQTAFYSNLAYIHEQRKQKVKPDAMVIINGNNYAVEIDRATENHEQLLQKFRKYKEYYDYCQRVEDKTTVRPIHTILFVVEERSRRHGIQRRWTNVLSAFFKAFDQEFPEINLVLAPMNEIIAILDFEHSRSFVEKESMKELLESFAEDGFDNVIGNSDFPLSSNSKKQCKLAFVNIHHEFESRLYKDHHKLLVNLYSIKEKFKQNNRLAEYEILRAGGYWLSPYNTPKMAEGIEKTGLHSDFAKKLNEASRNLVRYRTHRFN